ncbi:membrane protein-like protein (plasmid) [Peptoclostridium acidaminophilum DSM 3953]|uniref:Membrane protein-like protein n=1 Tax=Peptoclostridium acidaminophilum DSM 3953 TaxID=1286171 RepID=W8T8N7_PEPAC|nr:DUF2339 domain-containing protein [Peptoclostridium acidaminophilum]AHM58059.1 membrane protein-like protein [Peptoclostridium acidaminophilum DSM 3953]
MDAKSDEIAKLADEITRLKERVEYLEQMTGVAKGAASGTQSVWKRPLVQQEHLNTLESNYGRGKKPLLQRISEEKLAGTLFNRLGILAVVLAAVFFLKWSFDNNLIGELGRIAIGIIFGLGMLGAGEYFQRRQYAIYAQGFTGGGIAVLYFSIYAAYIFYSLMQQPATFALMVLITIAASLLAVRYDSLAIGIIGIVGGFATPFLLGSGEDRTLFLFSYVLILDVGVLLIAYFKKWPAFNYLTFVFTYASYISAYDIRHYTLNEGDFDVLSFAFLTIFFTIYLAVSFARNVRHKEKLIRADVTLVLLNAAAYFGLSYELLEPYYGDLMGLWTVLIGLVYLLLGLYVYSKYAEAKALSLTLLAVAAGFVTLAVPIQLDEHWVTIAWAVETVIVFYLNLKINPGRIPVAGYAVLFLMLVSLLDIPFVITGDEALPLLNKAAVAYIFAIVALSAVLRLYHDEIRSGKTIFGWGRFILSLQILLNILVIMLLTNEINAYFSYKAVEMADYQAQNAMRNRAGLVISMVWGLYAAVLVAVGFWKHIGNLRRFGLGFMGIVILKVFFVDLSSLTTANRIMSFFGLGVILLAVSWIYNRYKDVLFGGDADEKHHGKKE